MKDQSKREWTEIEIEHLLRGQISAALEGAQTVLNEVHKAMGTQIDLDDCPHIARHLKEVSHDARSIIRKLHKVGYRCWLQK